MEQFYFPLFGDKILEPVRVAWVGDRVMCGDKLSITMAGMKFEIFKYA